MTTLNNLELSHTRVTDAGLTLRSGLNNLRRLSLGDTKVTDEGVKRLQEALPNTRVSH